MNDLFGTGISIEKMAAYLDGNLPEDEMQLVWAAICHNRELSTFVDVNNQIEATFESYLPLELESPIELDVDNIDLPQIDCFENYFGSTDIFSEKTGSMPSDNINCENMRRDNNPSFGQLTMDDIKQQYPDTCAIKTQQLILESHGINVSEEELVKESIQKGWYNPDEGGTVPQNVGNILEDHGMKVHRIEHATIDDLTSELAKGHQVIVGVDSGELWSPGKYESFEDFLNSHGADHALLVSGFQINPLTAEREVILTDTGTGEVAHTYSIEQFQDAWEDSDNFMLIVNC